VSRPEETEAVAIRCVGIIGDEGAASSGPGAFNYRDGVMLGTYRHHAGRFTINGFNILGNLGNPAADRMLFNLVDEANADTSSVQALPEDYEAELASLGITDKP
jgi:hypothetical protein